MEISNMIYMAKQASIPLSAVDSELKNSGLKAIAKGLSENKAKIIQANQLDLERSQKENLPAPLLKRLKFDETKIQDVIDGIYSLIELEDPVGQTQLATKLDTDLELYRISCPIGVIGVIFESRPDALVQISTLCLKSGNSVLLKGGTEAKETNRILADIIKNETERTGIPKGWVQLLETRSDVNEMLKMSDDIDLIIPRGSNEFVKYIMNNSNIPVLGHADGVCHCYVHEDANIDMAIQIAVDAKTQYVAACNTLETLLVNEKIASAYLPILKEELEKKGVELLGCKDTQKVIAVQPASEEDWSTEYLDLKLSIKIVKNIDEAIKHINNYGSGHTDAIITQNKENASKFMALVDSSSIFWNCSTRFSDGFRYGFGAEVGISTSKIHARGPVGLDGLVIYKYKLLGNGHIVKDYADKTKQFKHIKLNKKCYL